MTEQTPEDTSGVGTEMAPGIATCDTNGCPAHGMRIEVGDGNASTICGGCKNLIPTTPTVEA